MTDQAAQPRPSAAIIAFPTANKPGPKPTAMISLPSEDPAARLRAALAALDAAVTTQRAAVADWRTAIGDLRCAMSNLGASVHGYRDSIDQLGTRATSLGDAARKLHAQAEILEGAPKR